MPENFLLYVATDEIVPLQELFELTGNDEIQPHTDGTRISGYTVTWEDVTVKLMVLPNDVFKINRRNMVQFMGMLVNDRNDKRARKAMRRAEGMALAYEVTVTPGWDEEEKAEQILNGVMAYYDYAFIFANDAFYNENGNRIVGTESSENRFFPRAEQTETYSKEAIARKKQSLKRLAKEGVPYIEHLPPVADADQTTLRPVEDSVKRALALILIADRAKGGSVTHYQEQVQQYGLADAITPDEKRFALEVDPDDYLFDMYDVRYESAWALFWALGYVESLGRPDHYADKDALKQFMEQGTAALIQNAKMRDISTILDETDLIYRYHWAIVDAELYNTARPEGLLVDVVEERHRALNWLIGYQDQDWDAVTTDT